MTTTVRMRLLGFIALIGVLIVAPGCKVGERSYYSPTDPRGSAIAGSGNVIQESRSVSGVSGVRLEGVGNVEIVLGGNEGLTIEADDNLLQYLRTEVVGGALVISKDPGVSLQPSRPIVYRLTAARMETVKLTGAGSIRGDGSNADRLELRSTGVGDIEFYGIQVTELDASATGVGHIRVSGSATSQRISLSGMTEYAASDLESIDADVQVSSNGSATVRVSQRLIVSVTGSGCVYYIGDPQIERHLIGSVCLNKIG